MICEPAILSFWKCAYCSQTAVARFRFHWKTTNGFWTNKIRHYIILHHDLSDWVLQSGILAVWGNFWNIFEDKVFFTGVARIFQMSDGRGDHTVLNRGLSSVCHLNIVGFLLKKRLTREEEHPRIPTPLAMRMLQQCNHAKILTEWQSRGDTCKLKHSEEYLITCLRWTCHIHND